MFKNAAYAAAAAVAFTAVPASAATVVGDNSEITLILVAPTEATGGFNFSVLNNTPGNTFTATYTFDNKFFDPSRGSARAAFTSNDRDYLTFTDAKIDGMGSVTFENGTRAGAVFVFDQPLALGMHELTISGTITPGGNGVVSVNGGLTLNAVPEPATWALFILGFGAVGAGMRRRSSQVRAAKASIRFA